MSQTSLQCLACGRDSREIPIVQVQYLGATIGICPQHLPVLIHDPTQLAGRLAGAESMEPARDHD